MNKFELQKYTLTFRDDIEDITSVTMLFVDDVQAIEVGKEMLKMNNKFMVVTILNSSDDIVKSIYKKNTRSLLEYMRGNAASISDTVWQLKNMSDEELRDVAYLIRKLLRHCDYNSSKHEIRLRSEYVADLIDNSTMVLFSKLLMDNPYSSSGEVADMISIVDGKKGGEQ